MHRSTRPRRTFAAMILGIIASLLMSTTASANSYPGLTVEGFREHFEQ